MVRYQAGQLEGFDELYALASPMVCRFHRARVADVARADDLVQETFLKLHQARHTYDPAYPLEPWLLAIARHTWLMDVRTRSRRPHAVGIAADDEGGRPFERLAASGTSTAEMLAHRDEIGRALHELPVSGRTAVVLHHVWGYSFAEIARRAGVSEAAVKLRSSRGLRALRAAIGRWRTGETR